MPNKNANVKIPFQCECGNIQEEIFSVPKRLTDSSQESTLKSNIQSILERRKIVCKECEKEITKIYKNKMLVPIAD